MGTSAAKSIAGAMNTIAALALRDVSPALNPGAWENTRNSLFFFFLRGSA
jgi:hypothetical protein